MAGVSLRRHVVNRAAVTQEVPLVELVDRLLHRGVVLTGELTVSVAGVDLVYVGLSVVVASVETIRRSGAEI
jgi:hypothetical protein